MRNTLIGALLLLFGISCSTDVDVNAPFVETPIIYSIVNTEDSLQIFRLEKAFSGENGNALELSQDPEQIYYDPADVKLTFKLAPPNRPDEPFFIDTLQMVLCDTCKEEGDFYSDSVPVYLTTRSIGFTDTVEDTYDAFLEFMNIRTGVEATAQTGLIPCFNISTPQNFCNRQSSPNMTYDEIEVRFSGPENGSLAYVSAICTYFEEPVGGGQLFDRTTEDEPFLLLTAEPLNKSVDWIYEYDEFDSLLFGNYLNRAVDTSNNNEIQVRYFENSGTCDWYFTIFNQDYRDYQQINNNFNPITQTSPIYTNVDNGLGLMGAMTQRVVTGVVINTNQTGYFRQWPSLKSQ